jgi:type I restriction enzyme S subunit
MWSSIDQLSADDSRAITDGPFGANLKTEHYIDTPGYRVIRLQNIGNGMFRDEHRAYINQERFEKIIKHQVSSGDLVIAGLIDTSIRCCYVPANIGPAVVKADCYRFSVHPLVSSKYVLYYLNSKMAHEFAAVHHHGLTLTRIGLGNFRSIPVPLPPAAEQRRIVAKVDQLMALCDQLKTCLNQARQINEQLACTLVERALAEDGQRSPIATDRQAARTLLAAEITHQLHSQRTFGQRKLQKVIYLAEHTARLAAIQGNYLRDAAGPHDRQLMNKVEGEMQNHQWYERIERETVGYAYRPLSQAGQHRQAYSSAWSVSERSTIEHVIELMRDWDTDRCEMTVTLYAAWNDFILEGRPVSDEAIVDEVMHSWNDTKLRFGKTEWLAVLAEMKKHKILMPTGFGKRTKGGMLSLPGFE